jgi:hypothetical protein
MGVMIIRHKIKDYGHWRPIFDGHAEMQKAAGTWMASHRVRVGSTRVA